MVEATAPMGLYERGEVDVIPDFIGNEDLKRLLLWAMCRYDPDDPDRTVGIIVISRSGEGKTWFLRAIQMTGLFDADIFNRDSLTPASMGTVRGKKVKTIEVAPVSCFDELDKWSSSFLSQLLQIFGKEQTSRARAGIKFQVKINTLPLGTLLASWKEFEWQEAGFSTSRRIHSLEQLLRRCVILKLDSTTDDPELARTYIESVLERHFYNVEVVRDFDADKNRERLIKILETASDAAEAGMFLKQSDVEGIVTYIDKVRRQIVISEHVSYAEEFPHLLSGLAEGRALSEGRNEVALEDFKIVGNVLVDHATRLGLVPKKKEEK